MLGHCLTIWSCSDPGGQAARVSASGPSSRAGPEDSPGAATAVAVDPGAETAVGLELEGVLGGVVRPQPRVVASPELDQPPHRADEADRIGAGRCVRRGCIRRLSIRGWRARAASQGEAQKDGTRGRPHRYAALMGASVHLPLTLADQPEDVVQWIPVAIHVEHRGEPPSPA